MMEEARMLKFNDLLRDRLPGENDEARRRRLVDAARLVWADDGICIDNDAQLSDHEGERRIGTWVQAWVWIDFEREVE